MQTDLTTRLASAIVMGTGVLWGVYWLPVRALEDLGLSGAWGTVAITLAAVVVLAPFAGLRWRGLVGADWWALASIALGGAAFALYSIGFVYGHVAIVILLWFLTPVWSTLIARFVLGWSTPPLRYVAIGAGLLGLVVMLGAGGQVPWPGSAGEWMSLGAGMLWSVATTGIRVRPEVARVEAAFVFALGAAAASLCLAPFLGGWPAGIASPGTVALLSLGTGGIWWGLLMIGLMWATVRLEPARSGILLMTEVLVGAVSAALIAGEVLSLQEVAGGALVLCAAVLEVWPVRRSEA